MRVGLILPLLLASAAPGQAVEPKDATPSGLSAIEGRIARQLPEHVGAAVLVRLDGETVLKRGFGSRRLGTPDAVTADTAFRLASASKIFTAAATLRLVDDGRLSLDDTLDGFFADLPEYARGVTVEQLLQNTSGLPSYEQGMSSAGAPAEGYHDADVVGWLRRVVEPMFEAGESCRYCGTNYVLLGLIVEQASGQPFEEFLRDAFFEPLGMTGAALLVEGESEPAERAYGHDQTGRPSTLTSERLESMRSEPSMRALEESDPDAARRLMKQVTHHARGWRIKDQSAFSRLRGDGCVYASLNDLEKWFAALGAGELLSEASTARMTEPQATPDEEQGFDHDWEFEFTHGFLRDALEGETRLSHRGSTQGFRQTVQWFPDSDSLVVVLINSTGPWDLAPNGEKVRETVLRRLRSAAPPRGAP